MALPAPAGAKVLGDRTLGARERAVLAVLLARPGCVVDRAVLRQKAGLTELNPRRCEAALVRLRLALGAEAIVTVRRRGWMLRTEATALAGALISSLPV